MMRRLLRRPATDLTAVVALSIAMIGCGSADGEGDGLRGAMEVAAGAPAAASDAGCDLDRSALAAAIEVFVALNGEPPTSEQDLVDAQMIVEPTENFDVDGDGEIVAQPGSPCA
jgi:hypothetical protein